MPTAAILLATVACADQTPTATLKCGDTTLIGRLLEQLTQLEVDRGWVITRPGWESEIKAAVSAANLPLEVRSSADVEQDLATIAEVSAEATAPGQHFVVASADILTHKEALAGLLADPRIVSGILTTTARPKGSWAVRTRAERGRVVSAGSAYHKVRKPTGYFLNVVKVDRRDIAELVASASKLAKLAKAPVSDRWAEAFQLKQDAWRRRMVRRSLQPSAHEPGELEAPADAEAADVLAEPVPLTDEELDRIPLEPEAQHELALRAAAYADDAVPLVLVGLVRSRVHLTNSYLRQLYWARPLSQETTDEATANLHTYDEDKVLLNSAVKGSDGFFTTYFVSPYSKYLARWSAKVGLTPNIVTSISMALGAVAAVAFATGSRLGMVIGALVLQAAFTFDCVDGQLARYTRQFSKLGAWLDSVFDRGKEYLVFAGLAIGATAGFDDNVWALAAAALALQTVRHTVDFSYATSRHQVLAALPAVPLDQPEDRKVSAADAEAWNDDEEDSAPVKEVEPEEGGSLLTRVGRAAIQVSRYFERRSWMRWLKKIVVLPIGERFALISLTAAIWEPRVTFIALLAWGGFALAYQLTGKILRSVAA